MIDFTFSPEDLALRDKVTAFIGDKIMPLESDPRQGPHGPDDTLRRELNALASKAGVLAPHVAKKWGGMGLNHQSRAIAFEAAGYSTLGPLALNCAAPDEGNMHLLEEVASEAQKQRWLKPLASGEVRSCFAMTEPHPGAGSDPTLLKTTARRKRNGFVINGCKWLITGAEGAAFVIIMANFEEKGAQDDTQGGATMFFADMDTPGIHIDRLIDTIDQSFPGGHAEMTFEEVWVPADHVLGEVGAGFKYAQVRLAPARLTHCMRWLGAACRAHDIALDYARKRYAFGRPIGEHEGVGFMLADNEIELHQCRLAIQHTAWVLDQGHCARHQSSMTKVFCSEALYRIADRCVQILGGLGLTGDTVVERTFREIRAFRIYDGPSEVHRWAIARRILKSPKGTQA